MFAVGMAIGVIIGVGILFVVQVFILINKLPLSFIFNIFYKLKLKIALKNQTGIEEWIVKKVCDKILYI